MKLKIITIGVYGFTEDDFFAALVRNKIDTFCDLRARRGVRGAQYAFVNSNRLQARLNTLGITYLHFKNLAPSKEIRKEQEIIDKQAGVAKRQRTSLSPAFIQAYETTCLSNFKPNEFIDKLGSAARIVALFCVEQHPEACHRSLVAKRLADDLGIEIENLIP